MSCPAIQFLVDLGYKRGIVSTIKAPEKVALIAAKYGYKNIPKLDKNLSKQFISEFLELENRNHESFRMMYTMYIARYYSKDAFQEQLDITKMVVTNLPGSKFYKTREWQNIRYEALKKHGNECFACGRSPKDGVQIHVDHILPRSIFPNKALTLSNLQILCKDCNTAKSNTDKTDWGKRLKK